MNKTMSSFQQKESSALAARGERVDAWCSTRREILPQDKLIEDVYPLYASRASGQYLWDVDGNKYIDFILGFGTVVLGHAHEQVTDAVIQELKSGINLSPLWRPAQVELAELLTSSIPNAQMVFLMRTGSDATSGAVRLSRLFTGKRKVVRWGYNGWHDWCCSRLEGIPQSVLDDTSTFTFNSLSSLEQALKEHRDDVACVIMMPFEVEEVGVEFLQEAKALTHRYGAVFILDEMRSGFRMALGGAQEYFGISADLATYSKAMANGYAISAIVGRADILRCVGQTHMASTYYANSAEMVAAITTIEILKRTDAIQRIWSLGRRLQKGLSELFEAFSIQAKVVGYPPVPFVVFTAEQSHNKFRDQELFFSETIRRGVFFHPNHHWFVSAAHTNDDIDATLKACRAGCEVVSDGQTR